MREASSRWSALAVAMLVLLAALTPWAFGGTQPEIERGIAGLALTASLGVALAQALGGGVHLAGATRLPVLAFLGLGVLQLVPLPSGLHALVAPGSASVWHPGEAAAAALIGPGPHPLSIDPDATRRSLLFVTALVALAALAAPALAQRETAVGAVLGVTGAGLAVSVFGVVTRTLWGPLVYGRFSVPTVSPYGPFVSKNHFAGYVELATLLGLGLAVGLMDRERSGDSGLAWTRSPRASRVLWAYAVAIAAGLGVLVSLSRGGALSLLGGGLALVLIRARVRRTRHHRRGPLLAVAVAVALAAAALAVLPEPAQRRLRTLARAGADPAGSFRLDVWRDTLALAGSSPALGHGLGAFADALPRFKHAHGTLRVTHAENDYLELLADTGLLGLALALGAAGMLVRASFAALAATPDRVRRGLGVGALAALVALLVHSGLDFNLRIPSNALLAAFVVALAAGTAEREPARLAPLASWGVVVALIAALGLALTLPLGPGTTARDEIRAAAAITDPAARGLRLARAEALLTASLLRRPADAEGWVLLGWTRAAQGAANEAAALAGHGAALDPTREELGEQASRLAARSR